MISSGGKREIDKFQSVKNEFFCCAEVKDMFAQDFCQRRITQK